MESLKRFRITIMKKSLFVIPILITIFFFGCQKTIDYFGLIKDEISKGKTLVYRERYELRSTSEIKNVPSYVISSQAGDLMQLGDMFFLTVIQPNINYPLRDQKPVAIKWAGVLVSHDQQKTWQKFFILPEPEYKNIEGTEVRLSLNVVGIFLDENKLFVDIADALGAGSGEGNLLRISSSDGGRTWEKEGCYYFIPENYYRENNIYPQGITSQQNCSHFPTHILQ